MYCKHCGDQMPDGNNVCTSCGGLQNDQPQNQPQANQPVVNVYNTNTNANANINRNETAVLPRVSLKSRSVALILCIFLGFFGIHRFYVGKIGTGILWACTGGLMFVGWAIDILALLTGTFKDSYGLPLK